MIRPIGVAVGATGQIYVASSGTATVDEFSAEGKLLRPITGAPSAGGGSISPAAIALGPHGALYVFSNSVWQLMKFQLPG